MTINRKQLALIHVARGKLKLSDDVYRTALAQVAGVTSSAELDQDGFTAMMGLFEYLGFRPTQPQGENYGARQGMASFAQIELIRSLWREYTRGVYEGEAQLSKWLERCFKVSSLRFLTAEDGRKAITALKSMKMRTRAA
ncbi:regulatory protein GemA [Paracoccus sanguinis]|uniref:regulatory protein GemA n=1 Tax=Paracoccus sanguinis TaxID=1545044 RepID=UPI00051FAAEE|nr:regulatory protein GemA [Paracoccus sanguinis]KGJ20714.1 hypothetical protein IX55_05145 [Paracoccus sanguinis]